MRPRSLTFLRLPFAALGAVALTWSPTRAGAQLPARTTDHATGHVVPVARRAVAASNALTAAEAAMRGDLATVRDVVARGGDVNAPQGDGMTALHWAAERGDSAMVTALLRARADVRA